MYEAKAPEVASEPRRARQLPEPKGYKILIALPVVKDTSEGGILYTEDYLRREEVATIFGFVLDMGPDCYKDPKKFPSGPYCKKGDWVLFRSYGGTRFKVHDQELRLINDDSVEAVVEDPSSYERV
jgi:co-chaperonin GroES (HSP10)